MLSIVPPLPKAPQPWMPQFLLRKHRTGVTSVCFGPSHSSFLCDKLVSADQSGILVVWDMLMRESVAVCTITPSERSSKKRVQSILAAELHDVSGVGVVLAQTRLCEMHVMELVRTGDDEDANFSMISRHCVEVTQHGFCRFASFYSRCSLAADSKNDRLVVMLPRDDIMMPMYELSLTSSSANGESAQVLQCVARGMIQAAPDILSSSSGHGGEVPRYGQLMSLKIVSLRSGPLDSVVVLTTWESGHVAALSLPDSAGYSSGSEGPPLAIRLVHRSFPEPAMAAVLSPRLTDNSSLPELILVVASAEGSLHGYRLRYPRSGPTQDNSSEDKRSALLVDVTWEHSLGKGVECCVLSKAHGMLLICGGWDGTIRLFDVLTAQVVSILTQHAKHSISSLSSFDTNNSSAHSSGQSFWLSSRSSRADEQLEEDVFAAGSSDGTISVWAPPVVLRNPTIVAAIGPRLENASVS
jgi:WD40 repeat protein